MYLILIVQFLVISIGFFVFNTNTIFEYATSLYDLTAAIMALDHLFVQVWQMENTLEFIAHWKNSLQEVSIAQYLYKFRGYYLNLYDL